jgi:hypothetical protein
MVKTEYICKDEKCDRVFACYNSMYAHYHARHKPPKFSCPMCNQKFSRHVSRALHYYRLHVRDIQAKRHAEQPVVVVRAQPNKFSSLNTSPVRGRSSLSVYTGSNLF